MPAISFHATPLAYALKIIPLNSEVSSLACISVVAQTFSPWRAGHSRVLPHFEGMLHNANPC
jgi:hypothetical protein